MPLIAPATTRSQSVGSYKYAAADQTGITTTTDVTGLTGMEVVPFNSTGLIVALIQIGKIKLTAGTPPIGNAFILVDDLANLLGSVQCQPITATANTNGGNVATPPMMFIHDLTPEQVTGRTLKVQMVPPAGTWSILSTNVPCKALFLQAA